MVIAVLGLWAVRVAGLLLLGFGGGGGGRCGGCGNWGGGVVVVGGGGDGLGRRVNSVSHFVKQQLSKLREVGIYLSVSVGLSQSHVAVVLLLFSSLLFSYTLRVSDLYVKQ